MEYTYNIRVTVPDDVDAGDPATEMADALTPVEGAHPDWMIEPFRVQVPERKMRRLNQHELEDLVRWFAYHMSQETRRQLMGDMPVHYALLYPGADPMILAHMVERRIAQVADQVDPVPHRASI